MLICGIQRIKQWFIFSVLITFVLTLLVFPGPMFKKYFFKLILRIYLCIAMYTSNLFKDFLGGHLKPDCRILISLCVSSTLLRLYIPPTPSPSFFFCLNWILLPALHPILPFLRDLVGVGMFFPRIEVSTIPAGGEGLVLLDPTAISWTVCSLDIHEIPSSLSQKWTEELKLLYSSCRIKGSILLCVRTPVY